MKRVLWVCNIMLPAIARELNLPYSNREGWLSGIFEKVMDKKAPFTLGICFPVKNLKELPVQEARMIDSRIYVVSRVRVKCFSLFDTMCYGFKEDVSRPEEHSLSYDIQLKMILDDFKPDIIHIFGTEFPHCMSAARACNRPEKILIGMQGICKEIEEVYMTGLPEKVQGDETLRDRLRNDSVRSQQAKFLMRGVFEADAIKRCGNVTGRTRFDREYAARINPKAEYFHMNETMRREFYTGQWKMEESQEHRIFLGQGDYPLKGMHFMLEAMALLLSQYPDTMLYVAGNSIINYQTLKDKLKISAYGKYLLELIKKYGLEENIVMVGKLTAKEMKEQFLKCSVYVCPSVLENSPNTVGEAQLLGVPVAASETGGIPDMIEDGETGLLFPVGDIEALARAIKRLWDRRKDENGETLAQRISRKAQERARVTHDGERNYARLLEIYEAVGEKV
ncbi:MAG: glycosyltransferase family 4 protein [Lachnospiraceae bacterium]|nr:glycosyltransferase family 4 protein [Lachnospiraceae bacterium]